MRKHKIVSLILVGVLTFSSLTGCGKKEEGPKGGKHLLVGIPQSSTVTDYDDNAFTKYLEQVADVEIEFVYFSGSPNEYKQQLALTCGANDPLPDVLLGFISMEQSTVDSFGEDGVFLDLTDLIEQYGVNYKAQMAKLSEKEQKISQKIGRLFILSIIIIYLIRFPITQSYCTKFGQCQMNQKRKSNGKDGISLNVGVMVFLLEIVSILISNRKGCCPRAGITPSVTLLYSTARRMNSPLSATILMITLFSPPNMKELKPS